jgi:hypothetical protein
MTHLAAEELSAFLDGELAVEEARAHVRSCDLCQRELEALQDVDAVVAQAAVEMRMTPPRAARRRTVLVAASVLLGCVALLGGKLRVRPPAASDREWLAVQEQMIDGLELQAGGLSLCLEGAEGEESEKLSRLLAQVRADLSELRREHEDLSQRR